MEQRLERGLASLVPERSRAFLRHQKAIENKKGFSLRRLLTLGGRILMLFTLALSTILVVYFGRNFLLHSTKFKLSLREIRGLQNVPESLILKKLSRMERQNTNILLMDLDELRKSLELTPWIKAVVVRRVLPDKLIIEVTERIPIAFARVDHSTFLVDDEGILLENDPESPHEFDFPVIAGLETGLEPEILARNKKRVALFQELIQALDGNGAGLSKDLSEVHLEDPGCVTVLLNNDSVLVVLGADQLEKRFRRYLGMGGQIKQKFPQVDTVDLRFQDQVIIKQSNQSVSAPAPD